MYKCPECSFQYELLDSLSRHYARGHKEKSKENLYIDLFCDGIRPLCACGCGEETTYLGIVKGFREYKWGHAARVNNNWGHNPEALKKSQDKRRQMWANGEIRQWCKGLTKETDERLAISGKKGQETVLANKEELQRRAERMRKNRLDGTIPTLTGADHSQWKGGVSIVTTRCHASHQLYQEWKFPILEAANFKCQRCGATDDLEVHHNRETMASIIHKHMKIINPERLDDFDLQTKVVDAVVQEHIDRKIPGEVICHDCHKEEHPSYNYRY